MPTTTLMPVPKQQILSNAGVPLMGGKIYTYAAGTNNPKATYTDSAGTTPQPNPIPLNLRGEPDNPIYWSGAYKVEVRDALGNVIYTVDNYNTDPAGLWSIFTSLAQAAGSSLIGFVQAAAGAVMRPLQDKLRDLETHTGDYGIVADGTSQTVKFQKAIDAVSAAGGGIIKCAAGLTFVVGGLVPKPGVLIDLNGSTLKLADNAKVPIFFDGGVPIGTASRFGVINGTLDCNQATNKGINVVGGVWLTGWSNLDFRRLVVKNCYRIGLNLINCNWFTIRDYQFQDSGTNDGAGFFAYALNIDGSAASSRYFDIKGVAVSNVYGFGIHFYGCADFTADNLSFYNLTYNAQAIAITFTSTSRFSTSNVIANQVSGDSIEVNSCYDGDFNNYNIQQSGNRALLIGINTAGPNSARLRFNNFQSLATTGAYAASLSYLENCEFNEMDFDKAVSYNVASVTSKNNVIRNSNIASTAAGSVGLINKGYFILENVRFTDWTYRNLNRQRVVVSTKQRIAVASSFDISFPAILPGLLTADGSVGGTLMTMSRFTGSFNQGTLQTGQFLVNDFGTAANLSALTVLNSAVARPLTIAGDGPNKKITLTNPALAGSGIDLDVSINLEMVLFS